MSLDLVVPALFPSAEAPPELRSLRLPRLEQWLDHATVTREPPSDVDAWIAAAHGLAEPLPYAALALEGEGLGRPGHWLRADPVHLEVGQDAVALRDASFLEVTREEASALVDALAHLFEDDGLVFVSPAPDRWYVRVPDGEVPRTTPLSQALGRNIFGLLPQGGGRINWGSAITESQMLFAAHPVNAAREANRKPAINGVWFWGEGNLPTSLARPYPAIVGGGVTVRGIARLAGAGREIEGGGGLVVLQGAAEALDRGDGDGWRSLLQHAEDAWFSRLEELTATHGTVRVIVPGRDATRVFTSAKPRRWRWPRKPRPLADHA